MDSCNRWNSLQSEYDSSGSPNPSDTIFYRRHPPFSLPADRSACCHRPLQLQWPRKAPAGSVFVIYLFPLLVVVRAAMQRLLPMGPWKIAILNANAPSAAPSVASPRVLGARPPTSIRDSPSPRSCTFTCCTLRQPAGWRQRYAW